MNLTMDAMNEKLRAKGAQVAELSARLAQAATNDKIDLNEVTRLQDDLQRESAAYNALRASAAAMGIAQQDSLQPAAPTAAQARTRSEMLKSNEYARAFAFAIRNGITPDTGGGREEVKVLYDALTIGGGDPAGADGGFLVPEDISHLIREKQRAMNPLRDFFSVEPVSSQSGWRVTDTAPTTGMSQVDEMATVPSNDQPAFGKVPYTLVKYGLILPISKELAADEVANLFAYLARWGAKKETITENTLLLAALNSLSSGATAIAADGELKGLKKILNVSLDPAIAASAVILTNQDGFNILDGLEDNNGRPLLQWDPVSRTQRMLGGVRVAPISNAMLASAEGQAPFFLGDAQEFATLFEREAMEVVSTNIGGSAFATDSIQIRFIKRICVSKFDTDAMKMARITVA